MKQQEAFIEMLATHKRILYKVAYSYCRQKEDRADLVQDMVLHLWRAYPQFDERVLFSTWMYKIAMNVAISHYRSESKKLRETLSLEEFGLDVAQADHLMDGQTENMKILEQLIRELDELNRGLILLFLDGYSNEEIASMMGLTNSNVSTRINRIKQKLQTQFLERS